MMNISSATSAAPTQIPMMVLRARGLEVGGAVRESNSLHVIHVQ